MADGALMVEMPLELMREIRSALKRCGEDLQHELAGKYGRAKLDEDTTEARRYRQEHAPVTDAFYCINAIDGQPWAYNGDWPHKKTS